MTQTLPPTDLYGAEFTRPPTIPPVASGALTHQGQVRAANEDGVFAAPRRGIWAVADGMGGHIGGAEAAAAIVTALEALPRATTLGAALDEAGAALTGAGRVIAALAATQPGAVIGATVVALAIRGREWGCLWAGDSRAYRLRGGVLQQLTRDHTEVNDLLDAGVITPAEAETWPRRNVITRAVGVTGVGETEGSAAPLLDRITGELAPGDVFLLCSDGLMKHVNDDEIAEVLTAHPEAEDAAAALLELTLARGAQDNVTVVVVAPGAGPGSGPQFAAETRA